MTVFEVERDAPETARRANALWSHVCLACHYHRYEIGPIHAQVVAWRHEVAALIPVADRFLTQSA